MDNQRIEVVVAKALDRIGNDRYLLSSFISARVRELENGAKPLIEDVDLTKEKFSDIALREIAEGLIEIRNIVNK